MLFPLGEKLLHLGDLIREEQALRQKAPDSPELAELRKRMRRCLNDTSVFIRHHAPLEIKMAVGCITDKCDPRLVRLLALVTRDQLFDLEGHPTLAEVCDVCVEAHAPEYESYLSFRHEVLACFAAGCYVANKSPYYHSSAVLRLTPHLLLLIAGGVTSGVHRMQGVQRAGKRKND